MDSDCNAKLTAEIAKLKERVDELSRQTPLALGTYFSALEAQMKDEIVALAFKAAESIVEVEAARRDPSAEALRKALSPLLNLQGVRVKLNPGSLDGLPKQAPGGLTLVADPHLKKGEVAVESPQGFIDGGIKARLEVLKEALLKSLQEGAKGNA